MSLVSILRVYCQTDAQQFKECCFILCALHINIFVNKIAVSRQVGINPWIIWVRTPVSPACSTDNITVVCYWSAGVALTGVFTTLSDLASTEHAFQDLTIVAVLGVADSNWNVLRVNAVQLCGIVRANNLGVSPTANVHGSAFRHPLAGLSWRWTNWLNVLVDGEGACEFQCSNIILNSSRSVVRMPDKLRQLGCLLRRLVKFYIVSTSNSSYSLSRIVAV